MVFADIPSGAAVFVDANVLIYHFSLHPLFGQACTDLLERIERQEIGGFISAQTLLEVAHRLMSMEAHKSFGWSFTGISHRMKRHPDKIQTLKHYRLALDEVPLLNLQVLPIRAGDVSTSAVISIQTGLLSNDALVVALMRDQGLTHLASNDADFDRVPGMTRYAPV